VTSSQHEQQLPASPFPTARKQVLRLAPPAVKKKKAQPPRSPTSAKVGSQIRALRLVAGIPGSALARSAGVSQSMLSRIESGLVSPSIEVLDRIAAGLDVPLPRFFGS
jgi:ribosome-binding protein aMBF1 (putative translation factor)